MRAVIGLLAVATSLATLVAGCSSSTPGTAQPQPGGDTSTHTQTPATNGAPGPSNNYGAPRATHPLDTTKWQANPCTAVTPGQLAAIGLPAGKLSPDPQGNFCDWKPQLDVNYSLGFNTSFDPGAAKGLANLYEFAQPGSMQRLPDIDGVPAVTSPSGNTNGSCTIYLGATDSVSYAVAVEIDQGLPHYADPCTPAGQIAAAATETMKAG